MGARENHPAEGFIGNKWSFLLDKQEPVNDFERELREVRRRRVCEKLLMWKRVEGLRNSPERYTI
jgi:hypothetical protein